MKLAFELPAQEREQLEALRDSHADDVKIARRSGVSGAEWMSFAVNISTIIAPPLFTYLTVLVTQKKNVFVIEDGERKPLDEAKLAELKLKYDDDE